MKKALTIISLFALFSSLNLSAQTANIDFELTNPGVYTTSNAVSGWTVSSQTNTSGTCNTSTLWASGSPEFSIVSTPILSFPAIGNILQSPLGGSNIARLNNSTANGSITKLSRTYSVTSSYSLLKLAWSGVWDGNHFPCCENSTFNFLLKDLSGNLLSCSSISTTPGTGCQSIGVTYSVSSINGPAWSNWQVKTIDLSPYINSTVVIEIVCGDCSHGDHYGTLFLDAYFPYIAPAIDYCPQPFYTLGTITGPSGNYSYNWYTEVGFPSTVVLVSTVQSISAQNPSFGQTFTLVLNQYYGACSYTIPYTYSLSSVNIGNVITRPSCINGSSGSATVQSNGASFIWMNSTGSVVATNSVMNNVPAGNYTVTIGKCSSTSSAVVTINSGTVAPMTLLQPFCGNTAYFTTSAGSNFQWYSSGGASITPSQGGNAPSLTLASPGNGNNIYVGFNSTSGCRDSIVYTLISVPLGSISITNNLVACPNATNALAIISLTPATGSVPGHNSYSVFSTGTTAAYNTSLNPTSANTFSASGLYAGGTYSVNAFDGSCKYSISFSVTPLIFNYTLNPITAFTLCPGNSINAFVTFTSPPSLNQYLYSWSPSTYLNSTNAQNVIIGNNLTAGASTTIIYSVVVTSTLANCSLTKTLSVTYANPLTPTISSIPQLCSQALQYSITAIPSGGTFLNNISIGTTNGILTPSLATIGLNTFTYANSIGTCVARSSGSFVIKAAPTLTLSGNTMICEGQSTTLLANGADTYTWNNSSFSPFIIITPSLTNTFTVEGTNLSTNCSAIKNITVTVIPHPTLTISGDTLICLGQSAVLTVSGANTYSWNNSSSAQTIIVFPNSTNSYSVIGTSSLAACSSTQSIFVKVKNCTNTGIDEWALNESLNIFPNPSNGKLIIETKNDIQISLYDVLGKLILKEELEKGDYNLDLGNYPIGVYSLKADYKGETKIIKMVKTD